MTSMRVVLSGGPDQLPEAGCLREVGCLDDKVKVAYASGYEHFTNSGRTTVVDGEHIPVFHWSEKTRIAE